VLASVKLRTFIFLNISFIDVGGMSGRLLAASDRAKSGGRGLILQCPLFG
jgi:hypothetical protein